jgi:tetratricopeptide (TPR) repeat protein
MSFGARVACVVWVVFIAMPGVLSAESENKAEDVVIATYQKAIAIDPNDVIAHFNLGLAYYKSQAFEEAKAILEKCLRINKNDRASHQQVDGAVNQLLGIIHYSALRNDKKAVFYFEESLKFSPRDMDTYYGLGLAYTRMGEYGKALEAYKKSLEMGNTTDPELHFQIGRMQLNLGKDDLAQAAFEKALALKPDYTLALENLALLYHKKKEIPKAKPLLEKLVELEPDNFNANYLLGLYYFQAKDYSKMVKAYTKAVQVKPDLADAHYNLGMAYYFQTRYDKAIDALNKSLKLNPNDAEAYNLLGQAQTSALEVYMRQGSQLIAEEKYQEAVAEFDKILAIEKNNPEAKSLREITLSKLTQDLATRLTAADTYFKAKDYERAYNEYEAALRLDSNSQPARQGMEKLKFKLDRMLTLRMEQGDSAFKSKDYKEARTQYEQALQLKSDYKPAQSALANLKDNVLKKIESSFSEAQALEKKEKLLDATGLYKQILKWADIISHEAWQEKALNNLTRANSNIDEMKKKYTARGIQAFQQGKREAARNAFNIVLQIEPDNKLANTYIKKLTGSESEAKVTASMIKTTYYRGVDYYVKGNIELAIREWEKVVKLDPNNQDAKINIGRAQAKLKAIHKLTEGLK